MNIIKISGLKSTPDWETMFSVHCPYCKGVLLEQACIHCQCEKFSAAWEDLYEVNLNHPVETSKKIAWDLGCCLILYKQKYYILSGPKVLDFVWEIRYIILKIQGYLHYKDMEACIDSETEPNLERKQLKELIDYFQKEFNKKYYKRMYKANTRILKAYLNRKAS